MRKLLLLLILFFSYCSSNAQNLSNQGKEFWVGYGHNVLYGNVNGQPNSQEMVLYLGSTQAATVTVSINGTAYSQTYIIAANSVIQSSPIPKTGVNDARLQVEGLSSRGVHIVSDVPIVAYAHQYGLNSSGATMLMPVETYGFTYYSLNYTQITNVDTSFSWFYVVASENNTKVEITPSVNTYGGRPAATPFNVSLNKGQIYNVFGNAGNFSGLDVSGSKIKSIAGSDGKCHPIAVFSGSSRITICGNSGDILQQQIFPSSAWGTNYLTYPTINNTDVTLTNLNYFRVAVRDPTTKVKRNGVQLTGLINGFYYEYSSTGGDFIEANKPVLVSQYVPSMQGCGTYTGNGDPEMFYLSPLQQAVKQASFYSTGNQNILDNYVAIIVKNTTNVGLVVDGSSLFDVFIPHPQNPQYSIAIKSLPANQQHTIVSDSVFTAITYGFGQFESYGYNAGTLINNLDIIPSIKNVLSSGTKPSINACPNSPFNIIVSMAYKPTKAVWRFSQVQKITPGYDTTFINPVPLDSTIIDARTYYRYKLPNGYKFSDTGTYNIPFSVTAPEIDNCSNTLDFIYTVVVKPVPDPAFSINYSTCQIDTARFLSTGITGYIIKNFLWQFDDGTSSTSTNPYKVFPTVGLHPVKLTLTTDDGCLVDTIIGLKTNPKPTATFGITTLPACEGSTLTFSDTSFFGGILQRWYWDFGNGQVRNVFNTNSQTSAYPAAGIYTVKHLVKSSGTCASDTAKKVIQIFAKPQVKFGVINGCLSDSIVRFFDSTKLADVQVLNYSWKFGDPNASVANPNTSTVKNPVHKYIVSGTYTVTLTVTTANGCSNSYNLSVTVFPQPSVSFIINTAAQCISYNSFLFTNTSAIVGGTNTYKWSFGDGTTSIVQNPVHSYITAGVYNVKLVVTTDKGCKDSTVKIVTVNPKPTVDFNITNSTQCFSNNIFGFINTSFISSGLLTYQWYFGDGTTSISQSPIHSYGNSGTYSVKLIVTSDKGCKDSIIKIVTVNPLPIASFTINSITQCFAGNSFVFTNTSSVSFGTITYKWYFGDANTSTLQNPSHSYTAAGTYAVKLVVTSSSGCKDSLSKNVTVLVKPMAAFTVNSTSQCISGNNFIFTNTSTTPSGTLSYQWAFGDGATSILTSPSHSFTVAGVYAVKLIVTTSNGCKDSTTFLVTVNAKPIAAFNIVNTVQCLQNNSFSFVNGSSVGSGTISFQWLFGDGGTSTAQSPVYSYSSAGNFTVKLIVISDKGCKDSITKTVTVNPKPLPLFTINSLSQCITGNSFVFTNTSSVAVGTLTYQWTFGDGGNATTTNATHNYAAAGSYSVKLVVTTNQGCKDSVIKTIIVAPRPVAGFNINNATQCATGNTFSFPNTSAIGLGTMTYEWSFGDGGTSVLQNPTHSYLAAGAYTVRLIVTSDKGCKDTISKPVTVNPKPIASFTINAASQCLSGNNFSFTNTSTIIPIATLTYQWSFGDGGTSGNQSPMHSYLTAGSYIVRLITTSLNGCTDTVRQTITVNPKPFVSFIVNLVSQCLGGNNFVFTNNSTVPSGTISYQWSFGDGGNSTAQNPNHIYTSAGNYNVRLIVTSDKGCIDSFTKIVSTIPKPTAGFTINNASQCFAGNSFIFTNTSSSTFGSLSYQWFFGDGATVTAQNPIHNYTVAGVYTVKLIVTAGGGCKDSISQVVTVNPKPTVSFSVNSSPQCLKANSFILTNTSAIASGTISYSWTFGDGTNSTSQNPIHTFAATGTYTIKLVATSDKGCKDSTIQTVVVNPSPTASFSINDTAQCISGNSFAFTSTSIVSSGTLSYQWYFGDASISLLQNPTHTYLSFGNYPVKLVVTSANGCKDSVTIMVVVNPKPVASFTIGNVSQCLKGNSFSYTNTSAIATGNITGYQWSFGDGGNSTLPNPVHSYLSNGSFVVKLVVVSNNGCKDSITKNVIVSPMPVALFSVNNAGQCLGGNSFVFTNNAVVVAPATYLWLFGDGDSAFVQNPVHIYLSSGVFSVKLVVTSVNGCKDSIAKTVTVYPMPAALFSINTNNQCVNNNSFVFSNNSTVSSGTLQFQWSFGDGTFSNLSSPAHTYATAGTFAVKLIVTTDKGCKDSIEKNAVVVIKPLAGFTVNSLNQCKTGNNFIFTNTSVFTGNPTFQWSFGDGGIAVIASPTYSYLAAGSYVVKLIVINGAGCIDSISKTVVVSPQPVALFGVNAINQCIAGNSFVFTNQSTITTGSYNSLWSFGDGATSNNANPTHSYPIAGTYTVKLITVSNNGCKDSISKVVTVYPKPTATFLVNTINQCFNSNNFIFTNNSTAAGSPVYQWSFGDGGISSAVSPSHNYIGAGTYPVKLIVTSGNGCKDSTMQTVIVYPKPVAAFTIPNAAQCFGGNNFTFNNTSSVSVGTFSSQWFFGDGSLSNLSNPAHAYTLSGTYIVKLVVTTNNGCKDSTTLVVNVYPKPTVSFGINYANQCFTGNNFVFTNTSVSAGATSYSWTFGDGANSNLQSPSHAYTVYGIYTVKLVVTSGNGCKDSINQTVTVYPKPTPAFSINLAAQCFETNNFIFTNQSTIASGTYTTQWAFGDGISSAATSPAHIYKSSGVFAVKLIVASSSGCKDSLTQNVTVNSKPIAAFTINDSTQCLDKNNFAFLNTSVVSGTGTYKWTFGDATFSALTSPSHVYSAASFYTVQLVAYSGAGCKDSISKRVVVFPKVSASFITNVAAQCLKGNNFIFTNTSSVIPGTLSISWAFGDGSVATQTNTSHHYNGSGSFTVKLIATSNNGCTDTAVNPVNVYAMPVALFNINNPSQCLKQNSFAFSNVSTGATATSNQWMFGDGNTSVAVSPIHQYNTSGSYPVSLYATSTNGCADTIVKTATVHLQPLASFKIVANGECANNNNYSFTNSTILSTGTFNNQWAFGDGATSFVISPVHSYNAAGTFPVRLVAVSDKGCRDTANQSIVVKPKPVVAFTVNSPGQCVNTNNFIFINSSTGSLPVTQQWTFGDGVGASTLSSPTYVYTLEGSYNVKLLVAANGCNDSLIKTVVVYPKPTVGFAVNDVVQCLVGNNFVFSNSSIISSGTLQYNWSLGDGSGGNQTNPVHHFSAANPYTVQLIATSNMGCKDSTKENVTVLINPKAAFVVNNSTQCFNTNNFVFTNNSIAPAGTNYFWNFGDGNNSSTFSPVKVYANAMNYKVTLYLSSTNGCSSDTATTSVSVIPNPIVNAGPDLVVQEGKTVIINAIVTNALTFKWTPRTYLSSEGVKTPLTAPKQNIGYRLTATGTNGCTGYDSVYVKILKPLNIPNVFSPNGDGTNDTWVIKSLADYPGCTVEVFNRYGSQVFISNGYAKPWDGTYKGNQLPVATYYYIVDPKNGLDKVTGYVVILR